MRILAIDPGTTESAWCVLEDGVPHSFGKEPNADLLAALRDRWAPDEAPAVAAIEMIASYGMPVGREVFETCLWIGRFQEAWLHGGGEVRLVYRMEVKRFLCHSMKANDANIRAAIIDHYGPGREIAIGTKRKPGPCYGITGDEWAALAVALTAEAAIAPPAADFMQPKVRAQRELLTEGADPF